MRQRLVVVRDGRAIERDADAFRGLQRRQLPEPTEQTLGPTPHEDDLALRLDPHERPREHRQLALLLARGDDRQLGLSTGARSDALRGQRTHEAAG